MGEHEVEPFGERQRRQIGGREVIVRDHIEALDGEARFGQGGRHEVTRPRAGRPPPGLRLRQRLALRRRDRGQPPVEVRRGRRRRRRDVQEAV